MSKQVEVLAKVNWVCQYCGETHLLHVRPVYFVRGRDPWSYPEGALVALCSHCETKFNKDCNELLDWEVLLSHIMCGGLAGIAMHYDMHDWITKRDQSAKDRILEVLE